MIDLIAESENILDLYWLYYKKCLAITHNADCDEQEFIELGKAANQWRLQKELVEKLKTNSNI
jgi:hypothetical protein